MKLINHIIYAMLLLSLVVATGSASDFLKESDMMRGSLCVVSSPVHILDLPECVYGYSYPFSSKAVEVTADEYLAGLSFSKYSETFEQGTGNSSYCTYNGEESDMCEVNCALNVTGLVPCCGDDHYCQSHNCTSTNCQCKCVSGTVTEYLSVFYEKDWISVTRSVDIILGVSEKENNRKRNSNVYDNTTYVQVSYTTPTVTVLLNPPSHVSVFLRKDTWSDVRFVSSVLNTFDIPEYALATSGYVFVDVYSDNVRISSTSFFDTAATMCRLKDCIWCADAMNNWDCVPRVYKIIVILIITILVTLTLCLLPGIVIILGWVYWAFALPIKKFVNIVGRVWSSPMVSDASGRMSSGAMNLAGYVLAKEKPVKEKNDSGVEVVVDQDGGYSLADARGRRLARLTLQQVAIIVLIGFVCGVVGEPISEYPVITGGETHQLHLHLIVVEFLFASVVVAGSVYLYTRNRSTSCCSQMAKNYVTVDSLKGLLEHDTTKRYIEPVLDNNAEADTDRKPTHRRNVPSHLSVKHVAIILLVGFVCSAVGTCTQGALISSTLSNCLRTSAVTQSCSVQFSTFTTINSPGLSTCYSLADETGVVFASVEAKFNYVMQTVALAKMYYTAPWIAPVQSVRQCPGSGACVGTQCAGLNGATDRTAYGTITAGVVTNYPGLSRCDSDCGCAGCGCFLCSSSCIYSGFGINPIISAYRVSAPGLVVAIPTVTLNVTDASGASTIITATIVGSTYSSGNVTFQIVGSFTGYTPSFLNKKVLDEVSSGRSWLVDASPANAPVAGSVGDIQANTAAGLFIPSTDSFIWASGFYSVSVSGGRANYIFTNGGIKKLMDTPTMFPTFPILDGGNTWVFNGGNLIGNVSNPGAIALNIGTSTNKTLTVTRYVSVVCPSVNIVTASGCFSCTQGMVVVVSGLSTCLAGFASVSTNDVGYQVATPNLLLTLERQNFTIQMYSSVRSVVMSLTITGNGGTVVVPVNFTAYEAITIGNQTFSSTASNETESGSLDTSSFLNFFSSLPDAFTRAFGDVFSGVGSTMQTVFVVIFIIVGIIVLGLLLPIFYKTSQVLASWIGRLRVKMGSKSKLT